MPVTAVVLAAAALHATWNAMLKPLDERLGTLALGGLVTGLGLLAVAPFVRPGSGALPYIAASGLIHVIYDLLLMRSYGAGDFNQVYPLARGTSPLVVTGAAALVASEHLEARPSSLVSPWSASDWRCWPGALGTGRRRRSDWHSLPALQ